MKLLMGFFILMIPLTLWASPISISVLDVNLNTTTLDATSSAVSIADLTNPTIFLTYNESTAAAASIVFTVDVSRNGNNWIDGSFFDFAGGPASFQTSETVSVNGSYVAWLEKGANYPFVRVLIQGVDTSNINTAAVVVFIVGQK